MDEICVSQEDAARILCRAAEVRAKVARDAAPYQGLCSAVIQIGPQPLRAWLFTDWPEYSGTLLYPVPAPVDFVTDPDKDGISAAEQAFDAALDRDTLYVGEYGAARMRLLDHIEAKLRALV